MKTKLQAKSVLTFPVILAALIIILVGNPVMQGQAVRAINGRSGATMTLQTADPPKLVVLLPPNTQVDEVQAQNRRVVMVLQNKGIGRYVGKFLGELVCRGDGLRVGRFGPGGAGGNRVQLAVCS